MSSEHDAFMTWRLRRSIGLRLLLGVLSAAGCGEFHPHFPRADAGRDGETPPGERFTLVALPDTQGIVLPYPEMFYAQAYWIRDKAAALNIKYVVHEGDITNDATEEEWRTVDHGFRLLDERVPYALALGNHDYPGGGGVESRDTSGFDARFPPSRVANQLGFVAMLDPDSAVNAAYKFWGNGQTWLIFALEFGPRDNVLSWVAEVLAANPAAHAILVTHAYLFVDGTRFDAANRTDQYSNPHDYDIDGRLGGVNDAEEMWQKLIAGRPQIRFVLCGHMHAQARLTSERPGAPPVHQLLADYQHEAYGGYGYLRLLTFEPDGRVVVQTYSPFLDRYRTDQDNDFILGP
ncbi:MAG: metallophosphoesterase [Deltaproteobacteria bacterium]|nr:metallophosphoesterase [Deltaproteobacteria bacterium]